MVQRAQAGRLAACMRVIMAGRVYPGWSGWSISGYIGPWPEYMVIRLELWIQAKI